MNDNPNLRWFKSSKSNSSGDCVEVANNEPGTVYVRDTKQNGEGPVLAFDPSAWSAFLDGVKDGQFS